jgi:serine O-acetyltransferase
MVYFLWFNWSVMAQKRDMYTRLVYLRTNQIFGGLAYYALKLLGIEIPKSVIIGKDFELAHGGFGVVIHPHSEIGDRVKIYPGVTLGRADVHLPIELSGFEGIVIEDDVILASGAKVLNKTGILHVRRSTVLGANSVLLTSTGENEIWGGIPANKIGERDTFKEERVTEELLD